MERKKEREKEKKKCAFSFLTKLYRGGKRHRVAGALQSKYMKGLHCIIPGSSSVNRYPRGGKGPDKCKMVEKRVTNAQQHSVWLGVVSLCYLQVRISVSELNVGEREGGRWEGGWWWWGVY